MSKHKYQYHPKDQAYLTDNGLSHLCYYIDKIVAAHKIGATCWTDAVVKAYRQVNSQRLAGKLLGVSQKSIGDVLNNLGVTKNGKGGANNPWGRNGRQKNPAAYIRPGL